MGKKAKTSRKGKKAWRANISTDDIDEFFQKSTKDALSGGSLDTAPSDSLFYLDKSRDLSVKRKIEKHREKVLHCNSVLQRNNFIQPVPSSKLKKSKSKKKDAPKAKLDTQDAPKGEQNLSTLLDIWDDKDEGNAKTKRKSVSSVIPAVEVEPPGCSFNPSFDAHQDSLAHAVADEMQNVYRTELGPKRVPLTVPGEIIDEEDMHFLDADDGSVEEEDVNDDNALTLGQRAAKKKQVTRVVLNRRARRKEKLKAEAEAKMKGNIGKEIDCLPDIISEIAKEDEEKQRRHIRRVVAKQERLKSRPPRLGKHKFEPAPVQVLLSEEISGSLRKLKGCCTVARDRYKSLEKRGILVPKSKRHKFKK